MPKYGLIGFPLSHSFSKKYFNDKFEKEGLEDHYYELFPIESINDFPKLLAEQKDLAGINVTIPYKEKVMVFLDEVETSALDVGAVNCIKFEDGKKIGYNTDVYGFQYSLKAFIEDNTVGNSSIEALVLGTGGASKAVQYSLKQLNIPYQLVSRTSKIGQLTYQNLDPAIIEKNRLIINTTPLGMSPNIEECPDLPYEYLSSKHLLYDLIYNPEKTLFLRRGESAGAAIMNGMEMLIGQAKKNWEIWTREAY